MPSGLTFSVFRFTPNHKENNRMATSPADLKTRVIEYQNGGALNWE